MNTAVKVSPRQQLAEERLRHRWTQLEVAAQLGTTPGNVSRWERGITSPGPYFRRKLCELFGKSAQELGLTWDELLVPSPRPRAADPPPEELTDWRWAFHFCLERSRSLTSWELNFVATVARYQKPPSAKQLIILQRLVARCRNAAA